MRVAERLLGVEPQADVTSVSRGRVAAGSSPHVVSSSTCHGALGPRRPAGPAAVD